MATPTPPRRPPTARARPHAAQPARRLLAGLAGCSVVGLLVGMFVLDADG